MAFRNIVLPYGEESANPQEAEVYSGLPQRGYFSTFEVGAGSKTMKMDERGMFLGSNDPETAPFHVDMNGNINIKASSLTSQTAIRFYDEDGNLPIYIGFENVE